MIFDKNFDFRGSAKVLHGELFHRKVLPGELLDWPRISAIFISEREYMSKIEALPGLPMTFCPTFSYKMTF